MTAKPRRRAHAGSTSNRGRTTGSRQSRHRGRDFRLLRTDAEALCLAMIKTLEEPDTKIDALAVIERHGFTAVVAYLTSKALFGIGRVRDKRGYGTPETILDEYVTLFFRGQPDELGQMVLRHVRDAHPPPPLTPRQQERFVWGLLTLHTAAWIEQAGTRPPPADPEAMS